MVDRMTIALAAYLPACLMQCCATGVAVAPHTHTHTHYIAVRLGSLCTIVVCVCVRRLGQGPQRHLSVTACVCCCSQSSSLLSGRRASTPCFIHICMDVCHCVCLVLAVAHPAVPQCCTAQLRLSGVVLPRAGGRVVMVCGICVAWGFVWQHIDCVYHPRSVAELQGVMSSVLCVPCVLCSHYLWLHPLCYSEDP